MFAESIVRQEFPSSPLSSINDNGAFNDYLNRPENKRPLQALLEKRTDLNLAGKVRNIGTQRGHGGYSDIYIGTRTLANGMECKVAVKKLRAHIMEDIKFQKRLAKELYIWSKLDHPRILPLEGFYVEDESYPYLISKWMENGTVLKYLEVHPDADMLSLVIGIAEGISYLHVNNIVHSDIKPDNVLISDLKEPLLCDFGVSRLLAASETFSAINTETDGLRGTVRYMARELLECTDDESVVYSKESDVWAFGMTVFTLLTGRRPYDTIIQDYRVMLAIMGGKLPSWPEDSELWSGTNQAMQRMCESCWSEKSVRPSMDICAMDLFRLKPSFDQTSPEVVQILERLDEARRRSERTQIIADFVARVQDWKGHHPSNFGELILEDIFTVTREAIDREYCVYLFERIILVCKVIEVTKRESSKSNPILSKFKKQLTSSRGDPEPSETDHSTLLLKGRVFMDSVTRICRTSMPGPQYLLEVWFPGDDGEEFFVLRCRSEEQLNVWGDAINNLIEKKHRRKDLQPWTPL